MIITISGSLGSGKSTIGTMLSQILNFKHYSTGDFMREMAKSRDISFPKFIQVAKTESEIDKEIDEYSSKLVQRGEDNFVIDSRLAFHFIPKSIKIYLYVSDEEAAKRIYLAKRGDEPNKNQEKVLEFIKTRRDSENERYHKLYNINCHDCSEETGNYDYVIDTTNKNIGEVLDMILDFLISNDKLNNSFKGRGSKQYRSTSCRDC